MKKLREQLAKARRRFRDYRQAKADTRPHSDRRKRLARLVRFYRDRLDRLKAKLDRRRHHDHHELDPDLSLGAPHWGGCEDILEAWLDPMAARRGIVPTAGKEYGHTAGGDHDPNVSNASARDWATPENYSLRNAMARRLGIEAVIYDYGFYYFYVNGVRYRLQPIAGTHGTGPHLHQGLRRV